ncbi:unnamed protein product [Sympodiomycopsis kandeliae]
MHITAAMAEAMEAGHPLASEPFKRSYSDRGLRPTVPTYRRQSDSTLTRSGRSKDTVDADGRAKLREWAANALGAPPPIIAPCDGDDPSQDYTASIHHTRRSRTRSRSPPGSAKLDAASLHSRRKSLFSPNTAETTAANKLSSSPDRLATSPSEHNGHASPSRPQIKLQALSAVAEGASSPKKTARFESPSLPSSPAASEDQKGLAQRRMESGRLDDKVLQEMSSLALGHSSLLDLRSPATSSGGRTSRPMLRTPTQQDLRSDRISLLVDEDATPRPQSIDSPISTTSTCQSDEDRSIDSPLEAAHFRLPPTRPYTSTNLSFSLSAGNGTPPLDTLSDTPADRVGLARGLDDLNRTQASDGPIATVIKNARRGSHTSGSDTPGTTQSSLLSTSTASSSATLVADAGIPTAPPLSRSTLFHLGSIEGISPPALTSNAPVALTSIASPESSSVVSAGLEMGLGVSLATAALAATLPPGYSGLGNFAEPRYSRVQAMPLNTRGLQEFSPRITSVQQPASASASDSSTRPLSMYGLEDSAADNTRSNIESELARRKTTGWDAAKSRREISKRGRAETHDQALSHTAAKNAMIQTQKQEVSLLPHRDVCHDMSGPSAPGSSSLSSLDSRSTQPRASHSESIQLDTPSLSGRAMLSPDVNPHIEARGGMFGSQRDSIAPEDEHVRKAREKLLRDEANGGQASFGNNGGLMGSNVGGHFGPGVRAKVIEILEPLIATVPLNGVPDETIHLVEFGCLNSRSIPLVQLIISKFAQRSVNRPSSLSSVMEEGSAADDWHTTAAAASWMNRHSEGQHSPVSFAVIHEDSPQADFRLISQSLDSRSDSYLDANWQFSHQPALQNSIFPSFVGRPFASRIAPPRTLHFGISLMDLHWTHTPANPGVSLATSSHAELVTFLKARAHEFKQGGMLIVAFLARSEDAPAASIGGKKSSDIWSTLTNTLAPCIQRLVSCGMLKSDVARYLLDLPLHPRTPRQTRSALSSLRHLWNVEWSCGLGEEENPRPSSRSSSDSNSRSSTSTSHNLLSEPQPLRIAHPAWKAFTAGTLSKVAMAEHMIMLFKNLYEAHFRKVLREKGKLSKGAVEFVLDSLWDVVSSRVDDHPSSPMKEVEIEVTICALRRL